MYVCSNQCDVLSQQTSHVPLRLNAGNRQVLTLALVRHSTVHSELFNDVSPQTSHVVPVVIPFYVPYTSGMGMTLFPSMN